MEGSLYRAAPRMLITPQSTADLAESLKEAASAGKTIETGGAFSKRSMGGGGAGAQTVLSLASMTRVLEYEPNDLTISVEAGLKWKAFQELLAANGQMVPLDPPYCDDATVGGVLAANTSGPRRRLYGSVRDAVIGMKFATVSGEIIQSGGMVVKNVAGLDIGKLMIGSFGTLGVIGQVNFKLTPIPPASATFLERLPTLDAAMKRRNEILASVLQPTAIDLLRTSGGSGWTLALQAGATERVVERYRRELSGAELLEGDAETEFWRTVREFIPAFLAAQPAGAIARASVALQEVSAVLSSLPAAAPVVARAGNGVIYAGFNEAQAAEAWVKASSHHAIIEAATPGSTLERWPRPGNALAVMEQIKRMFDPANLLNRGRLYGRL